LHDHVVLYDMCLPLCLWECSVRYRPLHSFPTRRSSDLEQDGQGDGAPDGDLGHQVGGLEVQAGARVVDQVARAVQQEGEQHPGQDRKSTRLNSSHVKISYAVFCLKKKKKKKTKKDMRKV